MGIENPDRWDELIKQQQDVENARKEADRLKAQQVEQRRQEEEAKQEQDRLAREAQEKAAKEATARKREKERAANQAYSDNMNRLVQEGDLGKLMEELAGDLRAPLPEERVWVPEDRYRKAMSWLKAGMETAAQRDPEKFVSFIGSKILVFNSLLLLRSQMAAMDLIRFYDRDAAGLNGDLPKEVTDQWLPRITALQHAVEASAQVFAKVKHTAKIGAGDEKGKGRQPDGHRPDHGSGTGTPREQPCKPRVHHTPGIAEDPGRGSGRTPAAGKPAAAA
jgi:hypothetical protein